MLGSTSNSLLTFSLPVTKATRHCCSRERKIPHVELLLPGVPIVKSFLVVHLRKILATKRLSGTGKMRTADLRTCGRVNCGPSLRIRSVFYPCVGTGKTLYSERLTPRNDGGTLTGEDVICIPCINDTNHDTMIHEQCECDSGNWKL